MDEAVILGRLQNVHGFFVGDVVALAGLAAVVGKVAHADAPAHVVVRAALAEHGAARAAGTLADADVPLIFFQPVGKMLDVERLVFHRNGLFDRNDVHTDAGASGRHHLGDARQRQIRHALEEVRRLREHI